MNSICCGEVEVWWDGYGRLGDCGRGGIGNLPISRSRVIVGGRGRPSEKDGGDSTRYERMKLEDKATGLEANIASPPNAGERLGGSQAAGSVRAGNYRK